MMKDLTTNVLLIGKSGVGKSSLLNYLFGREVQDTGSGDPVTGQGIYCFPFQYDDDFIINISDTWGLEPNRGADWDYLISKSLAEHDKQSINEWYNTIFFCVSANAERIETFELDMIAKFLKQKNCLQVIVTHCKNPDDPKFNILKKRIVENIRGRGLALSENDIIPVSNVAKKNIGGKINQFGREKVFKRIIHNVWSNFREKVPYIVKDKISSDFEKKKSEMIKRVTMISLWKGEDKLKEFENQLNRELTEFLQKEISDVNEQYKDAYDYYAALTRKFWEIAAFSNAVDETSVSEFEIDSLREYREKIEEAIYEMQQKLSLIKAVFSSNPQIEKGIKQLIMNLHLLFVGTKEVQKEIISELRKALDNEKNRLLLQVDDATARMNYLPGADD